MSDLIKAIKNGNKSKALSLINKGVNLDYKNNSNDSFKGMTALIIAISENQYKIAESIIQSSTNLNKNGKEALRYAMYKNSYNIVKLLIQKDSNIITSNKEPNFIKKFYSFLIRGFKYYLQTYDIIKEIIEKDVNFFLNEINQTFFIELLNNNINLFIDLIKKDKKNKILNFIIENYNLFNNNKKKLEYIKPILQKIYEKPLGKNIWYLNAHGNTEEKVFRTSIPIVFITELSKPYVFDICQQKTNYIKQSLLKKMFLLNDSHNNRNNLRIYNKGDIVPEMELNYYNDICHSNGRRENFISQAGITHMKKYFKKPENFINDYEPGTRPTGKLIPRLKYHNTDTFPSNFNKNLLSKIAKLLGEQNENAVLFVESCRILSPNYEKEVKDNINKLIEIVRRIQELELSNLPPSKPEFKRIESLSSKSLNYNSINFSAILSKYVKGALRNDYKKKLVNDFNSGTSVDLGKFVDILNEILEGKHQVNFFLKNTQ